MKSTKASQLERQIFNLAFTLRVVKNILSLYGPFAPDLPRIQVLFNELYQTLIDTVREMINDNVLEATMTH